MSLFRRLFYQYTYLRKPPWDTGISPPELMAFISQHTPGKALDLGCGTGTNAITLAKNGWQVTGVDFVGKAVRTARRKAKTAGFQVEFRRADVTRLPGIVGPFDLILDIGCFHSLSQQGKSNTIKNIEKLLAANGSYMLYAFFKEPDSPGPGLIEDDITRLATHLKLARRVEGLDRGQRVSAWFWFEK